MKTNTERAERGKEEKRGVKNRKTVCDCISLDCAQRKGWGPAQSLVMGCALPMENMDK